ncbi:MAG: hypothetical protein AAF488_04840 [Planctomycetota bacterium]
MPQLKIIAIASIMACLTWATPVDAQSYARTGDSNFDGSINLADIVSVLYNVFAAPAPPCLPADDMNGDSEADVADAVFLIDFMFAGGPDLACPFGHYGRRNPTPPPCPGPSPCHPTEILHSGPIDGFEVWGPGVTHVLVGLVTLEAGATVQVLPGTTVLAEFESGLVVKPGAELFAIGTEGQPVVFASKQPCPKRGDWFGLYMIGEAPTNSFDPFVPGLQIGYGGIDAFDSSGVLDHVRIEYAGMNFGAQPAGLNLYGVGSSTTIQNVLVKNCQSDGIHVVGGTVPMRHVIVENMVENSVVFDAGYQGDVQYLLARGSEESNQHGIVSRNNVQSPNASPRTRPVIANFSLAGGSSGLGTGLLLEHGTAGIFVNGLVEKFQVGVDIDHFATTEHGELWMDSVTFGDNLLNWEVQDNEDQFLFTSEEFFFLIGGVGGSTENIDLFGATMQDVLGFDSFDPCMPSRPNFFTENPGLGALYPVELLGEFFENPAFRGGEAFEGPGFSENVWVDFNF